jgi:hypothetical protein
MHAFLLVQSLLCSLRCTVSSYCNGTWSILGGVVENSAVLGYDVSPTFRTNIKPSHSQNSTNLIQKSNTFPEKVMDWLCHEFPNLGNQIAAVTKFLHRGATYFGALRIDLTSCVTVLAPRILRWLPNFWKMCTLLDYVRFCSLKSVVIIFTAGSSGRVV